MTVVTSHVWVTAYRPLTESCQSSFIYGQELLAGRAAREGNRFREALHAVNAADGEGGLGFRWLDRQRSSHNYWGDSLAPWTAYRALRTAYDPKDEPRIEKGRQMLHAQRRARAALALERFGHVELAEQEWAKASELNPELPLRKYAEAALEREQDPAWILREMEDAWLDSSSHEEFQKRMAPYW